MGDNSTNASGSILFPKQQEPTLSHMVVILPVVCVDPLRDRHHPFQGSKVWGCVAVLSPTEPAELP